MSKESKFPELGHHIEQFLLEEEGTIPQNKLVAIGAFIMIFGIVLAQDLFASHRSHASHSSHSSHASHASHSSGYTPRNNRYTTISNPSGTTTSITPSSPTTVPSTKPVNTVPPTQTIPITTPSTNVPVDQQVKPLVPAPVDTQLPATIPSLPTIYKTPSTP